MKEVCNHFSDVLVFLHSIRQAQVGTWSLTGDYLGDALTQTLSCQGPLCPFPCKSVNLLVHNKIHGAKQLSKKLSNPVQVKKALSRKWLYFRILGNSLFPLFCSFVMFPVPSCSGDGAVEEEGNEDGWLSWKDLQPTVHCSITKVTRGHNCLSIHYT